MADKINISAAAAIHRDTLSARAPIIYKARIGNQETGDIAADSTNTYIYVRIDGSAEAVVALLPADVRLEFFSYDAPVKVKLERGQYQVVGTDPELSAVYYQGTQPPDSIYNIAAVLKTASAILPNAQSLGALTTGLLKNTVAAGVGTLSTAVVSTDYIAPNTGSSVVNNAMISAVDAGKITTGTLVVARGGTGAATLTANSLIVGAGTSAVTFIAPSTSGNILRSNGTVWQSVAPSFAASVITSGQIGVANGGTGAATLTANNLIVGAGTSAVTFIAPGTSGNILQSNGTVFQSVAPSFSVSVLTGTLPVANGGTGAATLTSAALLVGAGTSAVTFLSPGSSGNFVRSNGSVWQSTTITSADIATALTTPGPIGGTTPNTGKFTQVTIENAAGAFYALMSSQIEFTRYSAAALDAANMIVYRSRGTLSSPSAAQSGDTLGGYNIGSYDDDSFGVYAALFGLATQTHTPSAHGTKIEIHTTPDGASSQVKRVTVDQDGKMTTHRQTDAVVGGVIFVQTTSVTHGNSLTETNLLSGAPTLGANTLSVGRVLRLRAGGVISFQDFNSLATFRFKLGSTTLATLDVQAIDNSGGAHGFTIDIDVITRSTGASGTLMPQMWFCAALDGTSSFIADPYSTAVTTPVTFDTTSTPTPALTLDWDQNVAGDTATLTWATIELLN